MQNRQIPKRASAYRPLETQQELHHSCRDVSFGYLKCRFLGMPVKKSHPNSERTGVAFQYILKFLRNSQQVEKWMLIFQKFFLLIFKIIAELIFLK